MMGSRSVHSFRCADVLWRALEDEAGDRGITVDALITEALWRHLRDAPEFTTVPHPTVDQMEARATETRPSIPMASVSNNNPRVVTPLRRKSGSFSFAMVADDIAPTVDNLPIVRDKDGRVLDPATGEPVRQEDVNEVAGKADTSHARPPLALKFSGKQYPVLQERFLIGRASSGTDLQIRDANVSRKHAAVVFHDGAWFIHDLQSTNGIEFNGETIRTRRIEANDRYKICGYELVFELGQ